MKQNFRAFTLVELLVVIALLAILAMLVVPSLHSVSSAYIITRHGQILNDQLNLAWQIAASKNYEVELRFLESTESSDGIHWATQRWEYDSKTNIMRAADKKYTFDDSIILNTTLSPLLDNLETLPGDSSNEEWKVLRFQAGGNLSGQFDNTKCYLTIQPRRADEAAPENYYTLQINPITGKITTFRP